MLPRRRPSLSGTGSAALNAILTAALLLASSSAFAQSEAFTAEVQPYEFLKGQTKLARIDTSTGQVSTVGINGDGGWNSLGPAPAAEGGSNHLGRYGLLRLPPVRAGGPQARSLVLEPILRFDRATGRAWVAEMTQATAWHEIGKDAPEPSAGPRAAVGSSNSAAAEAEPQLKVLSKQRLEEVGGLSKDEVEVFIQAINKPGLDPEVKVWATLQLGAVDPDLSVPPLLEALGSDQPQVVAAAVQALAQTGVASVVPQILKLEGHPDPAVRAAVAAAVKRVD